MRKSSKTPINSLNLRDCHATYVDSKKLLFCSQWSSVLVFNQNHNLIKELSHNDSDIVTILNDHQFKQTIYSVHQNGSIISWDLAKLEMKKVVNLDCSICDAVLTKHGFAIIDDNLKSKLYDDDGVFLKDIFPEHRINKIYHGGLLSQYIASKYKDMLLVFWPDYDYVQKVCVASGKQQKITAITCGKSKEIVAVGHKNGQITVIWNLISDVNVDYQDSESVVPKKNLLWKPTPSEFLKRNMIHWHFNSVLDLEFSSSDKQLISGGLESVLVKWDLSEAIGDYKHRKFLPRLGAPISRIKCERSDDCVDNIVIHLQDNSIKVYSINFDLKFVLHDFGQLPSLGSWSQIPNLEIKTGFRGYTQPCILHFLQNSPDKPTLGLISNCLGKLQLIQQDKNILKILQNKLDITMEQIVPREINKKPSYSDCLLIDSMIRNDSPATNRWIVTYSELIDWNDSHHTSGKVNCFHKNDNQSRISWWLFDLERNEMTSSPVDSHCVDFLASPCIGLKFFHHRQEDSWKTLLLTSDSRLVIFNFDQQSFLTRKYSIWPYSLTVPLIMQPSRVYINSFNRTNMELETFTMFSSDYILAQTSQFDFVVFDFHSLINDVFPEPCFVWRDSRQTIDTDNLVALDKAMIYHIQKINVPGIGENSFLIILHQKKPFAQLALVASFQSEPNSSLIFVVHSKRLLSKSFFERFTIVQVHQTEPVFAVFRLKSGSVELYSVIMDSIDKVKIFENILNNEDVTVKSFETENEINYEIGLQMKFLPHSTIDKSDLFFVSLDISKNSHQLRIDRKLRYLTNKIDLADANKSLANVLDVIAEQDELDLNKTLNTSILTMAKPVQQNINVNSSSSDIDQERMTRKRKIIEPINKILGEISKFPSHLAPNPENILKQIYRQD